MWVPWGGVRVPPCWWKPSFLPLMYQTQSVIEVTEWLPPGDVANPNFLLPNPCLFPGAVAEEEGKGPFLRMAQAEELTRNVTRFAQLCFSLILCLWKCCPSWGCCWNSCGFGIPTALAGAGRCSCPPSKAQAGSVPLSTRLAGW